MAPDDVPDDDDHLDGCTVGEGIEPDDDDTADMRALFPDGTATPERVAEWKALAEGMTP